MLSVPGLLEDPAPGLLFGIEHRPGRLRWWRLEGTAGNDEVALAGYPLRPWPLW
jgi:hypothetical protein